MAYEQRSDPAAVNQREAEGAAYQPGEDLGWLAYVERMKAAVLAEYRPHGETTMGETEDANDTIEVTTRTDEDADTLISHGRDGRHVKP